MGIRVAHLVAVTAAACGSGSPGRRAETRVEADLRQALAAAIGAGVSRVTCPKAPPRPPDPVRCIAVAEGVEIPIAVRDDGATLAWEVTGLVVTASALEAEVAARLAELAITAAVDCGPRVRVVDAGARVECAIGAAAGAGATDEDTGRAFATIDADGGASIELALGAAAVAARTEGVAEGDLEALSRALDRDGDSAGDGDEVGLDAAPGVERPVDAAPGT